ncbi:MAG: hypothetical protein V1904_10755 [Bacteroidota bacterium]
MINNKSISSSGKLMPALVVALIILVIAGLSMQSCIKKEDFDFDKLAGFEYSPNFAAPLIHSKLTLRDILSDFDTNHLFVEDVTHFLYLIYNSTVFSQRADEIISIPDQTVNTVWNIPGPIPVGNSFVFSYSSSYNFTSAFNERFDSIVMKSGYINYSISADLNHDAQILVTIPGAKKNGQVFSKTISYDYQGSVPVNINDTFNLDGYTLEFGSNNQIVIDYEVSGPGDLNPDMSPHNVSLGESFLSLKFHKIFGYIGQHTFIFNQDSVYLDIFKNNIYGSMYFEDPRLNIYVNNAYGMPLSVTIDLLRAESAVNPPFLVDVTGTGVPDILNPWIIAYPATSQLGQSVQSSLQLNNGNTNTGFSGIRDAINISPHWVSYHVNSTSNPAGYPPPDQNFVIDTSRFSIDAEVELPMWGRAWDFRLQDTLDFSFGDDVDILEWVLFKINTDNGFPVNASMQLYFADSAFNKIDSLLVPIQQVIISGVVGPAPDYKVIAPTHKLTTSKIEKNRIMNLKNVEKLLIYAKLETVNNGATIIKMYSDYFLDVKIGLQAQIKTTVYPSNH